MAPPRWEPQHLASAHRQSEPLADFFGKTFVLLQSQLHDLGVEETEDLRELQAEEVERLASLLKPVQARKFVKAVSLL